MADEEHKKRGKRRAGSEGLLRGGKTGSMRQWIILGAWRSLMETRAGTDRLGEEGGKEGQQGGRRKKGKRASRKAGKGKKRTLRGGSKRERKRLTGRKEGRE